MMLRLRGDLHTEVEWNANRVPSVAECIFTERAWYRVTNVAWAVQADGGFDVALVLSSINEPPGLRVKTDG